MMRSGACLCGAVKVEAEPLGSLQACHCEMCRRWTSGPLMAVPCKEAHFEGPVRRYSSSEFAERGFCSACGTHLFFYAKWLDIYGVSVGLFDDQSGLPLKAQLFVDQKSENYDFANETKMMTGSEYDAKFRGGA